MRGVRVLMVVLALVGLVVMPAAAAAKPGKGKGGKGDDTILRTYVVTYSGEWHRQGHIETETATGVETDDYTDDANWNLRSRDKPIQIRTSRRHNFGSVTGGVLAQEMQGTAIRTQTNTNSVFGTSSEINDGPDILDASLHHDEGIDKQHALGVTGLDYTSYGDRNTELYPMPIDGRHPRKGYSFPISGSQTTSEPGFSETASINATWTLELARKKRLD